MEMTIKTKWGKIKVEPEHIYEISIRINPWDNIYWLELILDHGQRLNVEFDGPTDLVKVFKSLLSRLAIIRNYKYRDNDGSLQINEPMRLKLHRQLDTIED